MATRSSGSSLSLPKARASAKWPFDFSISDAVKERAEARKNDVETTGVPLELQVSVSQVEGDREPSQ